MKKTIRITSLFAILAISTFAIAGNTITDTEVRSISPDYSEGFQIGLDPEQPIRIYPIGGYHRILVSGLKTCQKGEQKRLNEVNGFIQWQPRSYNPTWPRIPMYTPTGGARIYFDSFDDIFNGVSVVTRAGLNTIRTDFNGSAYQEFGSVTGFVVFNYNKSNITKAGGIISIYDSKTGCFFGGKFK